MIVIANKTEVKLLSELRKALKDSPAQKVFYLELSKSEIPRAMLFEQFLRALEEMPNSYMAQVYLCQDKDIFMLMQGVMQRQFVQFIQKYTAAIGDKSIVELCHVFEIGIHWKDIEFLCKHKVEQIDLEEQRLADEKRRNAADKATLEVFDTLDPTLIKTIKSRRGQRDDVIILVVDDDQLSRTLIGNVLNKDFQISFAKGGAQALAEYLNVAPDVLFLDIGLPDISGHKVLECLFQFDPQAYVIMFSGRKDKQNIIRALETGAQGFVGKPFTRNELFEYIQKSPFFIEKQEKADIKKIPGR